MSSKRAFTLIELLVVIAIIALLLAILTPALRKAKEIATGVICQSNISGLGRAWFMYQEDYDGYLVTGSNYYDNPHPDMDYRWVEIPLLPTAPDYFGPGQNPNNHLADGDLMDLESRLKGIRAGRLWTYIESKGFYHCPGDKQWKKSGPVNIQRYRSYSISGMMRSEDIRREGDVVTFPNGTTKKRHTVFKMGEIASPSIKYVFVEEDADQDYNKGGWVLFAGGDGDTWWDPLAAFHNERSILGFADGHAEKINWQDQRTIDFTLRKPDTDNYQLDNVDMHIMGKGYFPGR